MQRIEFNVLLKILYLFNIKKNSNIKISKTQYYLYIIKYFKLTLFANESIRAIERLLIPTVDGVVSSFYTSVVLYEMVISIISPVFSSV